MARYKRAQNLGAYVELQLLTALEGEGEALSAVRHLAQWLNVTFGGKVLISLSFPS